MKNNRNSCRSARAVAIPACGMSTIRIKKSMISCSSKTKISPTLINQTQVSSAKAKVKSGRRKRKRTRIKVRPIYRCQPSTIKIRRTRKITNRALT